jgi:hypothetical protein
MAVPEKRHLFAKPIWAVAHAIEPPADEIEDLALLVSIALLDFLNPLLALFQRELLQRLAHRGHVWRRRHFRFREGCRIVGAAEDAVDGGVESRFVERFDFVGRAAEPGAIQQMRGLCEIPSVGGKGREHLGV